MNVARTPTPRTRLNADTSSQPEGVTRRVMLNILEAFFRRPFLHLLPLILMIGLGLASVLGGTDKFTSVGTLSVTNRSLLADLTNVQQTPGFTLETPASAAASDINDLLGTDEFLTAVITNAGLEDLLDQGILLKDQIRLSTGASTAGDSIVRVAATTEDSELSFRLSDATIQAYQDWVLEADVSQSTSTEESLERRVADKQRAANAADEDVREFLIENQGLDLEDGSATDVLVLDYQRLQDHADRAAEQLVAAEDALDAARLQTDQAEAVVSQRLRVVDEPEPAAAPEGRLKKAALTMILFAVIGGILTVVSVVVASTLDRTIRVPNDITAKFGVDVLAVVPERGR